MKGGTEGERGREGVGREQGTTNITGGRAAGENRPVISQDFVIETLLEVEGSRESTADKRHPSSSSSSSSSSSWPSFISRLGSAEPSRGEAT